MLLFVGCLESYSGSSLPAPVREAYPYTMVGCIPRVQAGDHFEFSKSDELYYILIRGVDCPKAGQPFYRDAWRVTRTLTRRVDVRAEVFERDEAMIETADVFVINHDPADIQGDLNVGLELLRRGMGWFDGNEFEYSDVYRQAESEARAAKIGLWSQDDPVPPWEFNSSRKQ